VNSMQVSVEDEDCVSSGMSRLNALPCHSFLVSGI
jgi:hypothetical protein